MLSEKIESLGSLVQNLSDALDAVNAAIIEVREYREYFKQFEAARGRGEELPVWYEPPEDVNHWLFMTHVRASENAEDYLPYYLVPTRNLYYSAEHHTDPLLYRWGNMHAVGDAVALPSFMVNGSNGEGSSREETIVCTLVAFVYYLYNEQSVYYALFKTPEGGLIARQLGTVYVYTNNS
jgi:hypothetical protein